MPNSHLLTPHQSQYYAWQLTRQAASGSLESLTSSLAGSQIHLNPHQIEAALFARKNPLAKGVILADEVGLGKTIEAGLVIAQSWAERRRRILIIAPANLRKQWHQELQDKFGMQGLVLEAKNYKALRQQGLSPFEVTGPIICSYQFAKSKADDIHQINWDLVVLDEAHRLRNVYKKGNVIASVIRDSLKHVKAKVLLTATPLQNSLLELYGLVSVIDEHVFGDLDSFRVQFGQGNREQALASLRTRLTPVCKRTLRRQVQPYVSYTQRIAIVEEFTPSAEEQKLSKLVADYLQRPNLKALPDGQRQLISLVLWKLLASSSRAIGGALETMANRLQKLLDNAPEIPELVEELDEDFEVLDETAEEWGEEDSNDAPESRTEREALSNEIAELRHFKELASNIRDDSKGQALLTALGKAFVELDRLQAPKKALIFTESKRTQDYLLGLLESTPYGDGIVLFNGTNNDARAQAIYKAWLKKHEGSDKITGSKTADTRAALVEHFKDSGTVMIATEAGAEGINLQFCSLVVNYDLPWNPQRIEQRIGRCHRYGQKHDVVVVNFIDQNNPADKRVYELLSEKFHLFEGVFGASDEVLGAIGSGVDFERRIADIYRNCRKPEDIKASFEQLQLDLAGEINDAMVKTRQMLLENFDEEVQARLRTQADNSKEALDRFEQMLLSLSETELQQHADFDGDNGFDLHSLPGGSQEEIDLGRYELPRHSGDAHLYRLGHPLAEWVIQQAKERVLPVAHLRFDYNAHGMPVTTLLPYRGQGGTLNVKLLSVDALGHQQQELIVSAVTHDGQALLEDDPQKLLRLPAEILTHAAHPVDTGACDADLTQRQQKALGLIDQRNLGFFEEEVAKLDAWADDLKLGLEQEIKETDREIKEVRRTAATAQTLDEKLHWQKRQRELEGTRNKLRRDLFNRQDEVEEQRNELIEQLETQLKQQVQERPLFTIGWELV
ncbi:SNF2-related protein [Pseudomonas sp. GD03855]|nr:SNF2-related protein [Pseudomonas sp. GD03856]MDH2264759.1 SNF2-related protein [Pseudomonas sp. GD03855]